MTASDQPDDLGVKNTGSTDALPLAGNTILVTRAQDQAEILCRRLESLGAMTIVHPVIRVLPLKNPAPIDEVISRIAMFDWIVFVSANGVRFFYERLMLAGEIRDSIHQKKLASIGPATFSQLKQTVGADSNLMPAHANSESLAEALVNAAVGQRVLVIRANRGSKVLASRLNQAGVDFEELATYQSTDIEHADPSTVDQIRTRKVNWVTMTSSAIARSTIGLFGEELRKTKTVSISPTTSAAMVELGFQPDAEARSYDMDGMIEALVRHVKHR